MDAAYTNANTKIRSKLGEGNTPNVGGLLGRHMTGKFGPMPSLGYALINSTAIEGEDEWDLRMTSDHKVISMKRLVGEAISPMTFPTIKEINERQPHGLREFLMLQGILGAGINTLDEDRILTQSQKAEAFFNPSKKELSDKRKKFEYALQTGNVQKTKEVYQQLPAEEKIKFLDDLLSKDVDVGDLGPNKDIIILSVLAGKPVDMPAETQAYIQTKLRMLKEKQMTAAAVMDKVENTTLYTNAVKESWK